MTYGAGRVLLLVARLCREKRVLNGIMRGREKMFGTWVGANRKHSKLMRHGFKTLWRTSKSKSITLVDIAYCSGV